jgi:hypothetical protein
MDRDPDTLTALLMDPFLTTDEAEREAATTRAAGVARPAYRRCPDRRPEGLGAATPAPATAWPDRTGA